MKKEKRNVSVTLNRVNREVHTARCSCPAGLSGYCNHVMALLLEVADYSLNQLSTVPEEIACTSRICQWGVPGEASNKAPVMDTVVHSQTNTRAISSTLFDPGRNKEMYVDMLVSMQANLFQRDEKIGFACCVPPREYNQHKVNTKYGFFGS